MDSYESFKTHQRFQRKPLNPYIRQPQYPCTRNSPHKQQRSIVSTYNKKQSFSLRLQHNTVSITINENKHSLREDLLSESLFSMESTPIRPYLGQSIKQSSNQKSTQIKLQYSPDPIFHAQKISKLDQSDLLLDNSQDDGYPSKQQILTTTSQTDPQHSRYSSLSSIHPICSRFTIYDTNPGIRASLLTISNYIFRIEYQSATVQKKKLFDGNLLVNRAKKYFRGKALELFYFYERVLKSFVSSSLRTFFIQKRIKYSSSQILALENSIITCLQTSKPQQIIDLMFFSRVDEDEFILNVSDQYNCDQIKLSQTSLWLVFHDFMHSHRYFRTTSSTSIQHLQCFISALI